MSCRITDGKPNAGLIFVFFLWILFRFRALKYHQDASRYGAGSCFHSFHVIISGSLQIEIFCVSSTLGTVPLLALRLFPLSTHMIPALLAPISGCWNLYLGTFPTQVFHFLSFFYILNDSLNLIFKIINLLSFSTLLFSLSLMLHILPVIVLVFKYIFLLLDCFSS